jgi:hypothetical protein
MRSRANGRAGPLAVQKPVDDSLQRAVSPMPLAQAVEGDVIEESRLPTIFIAILGQFLE